MKAEDVQVGMLLKRTEDGGQLRHALGEYCTVIDIKEGGIFKSPVPPGDKTWFWYVFLTEGCMRLVGA